MRKIENICLMFSENFNKKALTSKISSDKLKHRFNSLLKNFPMVSSPYFKFDCELETIVLDLKVLDVKLGVETKSSATFDFS